MNIGNLNEGLNHLFINKRLFNTLAIKNYSFANIVLSGVYTRLKENFKTKFVTIKLIIYPLKAIYDILKKKQTYNHKDYHKLLQNDMIYFIAPDEIVDIKDTRVIHRLYGEVEVKNIVLTYPSKINTLFKAPSIEEFSNLTFKKKIVCFFFFIKIYLEVIYKIIFTKNGYFSYNERVLITYLILNRTSIDLIQYFEYLTFVKQIKEKKIFLGGFPHSGFSILSHMLKENNKVYERVERLIAEDDQMFLSSINISEDIRKLVCNVDEIDVWTQYDKELLSSAKSFYKDIKVNIIGFPHKSAIENKLLNFNKGVFLNSLGFHKEHKIILYTDSTKTDYFVDFFFNQIFEVINKSQIVLIVKLRPRVKNKLFYEELQKKYEKKIEFKFLIIEENILYELMSISSVHFTYRSHTVVEASILNLENYFIQYDSFLDKFLKRKLGKVFDKERDLIELKKRLDNE